MEIQYDFFLINPGDSTFFQSTPGLSTLYFFNIPENSMSYKTGYSSLLTRDGF